MAAPTQTAQVYNSGTGTWSSYSPGMNTNPTTSTAPTSGAYSTIATPNGPQYQSLGANSAQTPTPGGNSNAPATYVGQDGNTYSNATGQRVTLSANTSTPISYGTNPAPAVINSSQASDYLGNVGSQINNLNTDASNQSSANSTPANGQGSTGQTNGQNTNTQTNEQGNGQNNNGTVDAAQQLQDQIASLMANLGEGESQVNDQVNNATTSNNEGQPVTFAQAQLENMAQEVQAWQQSQQQLAQIQSGVYPLSAAEQSYLSSTQTLMSNTIAQQQIANQAYVGQMTEAMASLGINQTAPTQAMGNIQAAISQGVAKINDLNAKMVQTVSGLQLAYQKQDYDQVQQLWADTSKQFEDRQNNLDKMQQAVATQAQQQKTDMQDFVNKSITALTSAATLANTNMNDAASRAITAANDANTAAYHQGTLDEKTYNDNQKLILEAQKTTDAQTHTTNTVNNIVDGSSSLADLTSGTTPDPQLQDVKAQLTQLGFYSDTPPAWYVKAQDDKYNGDILPDILQTQWTTYRNKALGTSS